MPETIDDKINKETSRRNFLKYAGATAAVVVTGAAGYYLLTREQPVNPPTTTTTSNPPITSQSSSPLASYAKDKGLSKDVIAVLDVKLGGEATKNNKSFVDYLYGVSQADVVSPEVLQFAPEKYKPSVVESLQFKTIGDVIKENKVSDQAVKSLGYLSGFPGTVQRNTIEFGLDDTTLEFLGLTAALPDQDSAKYFVEWRVPIQDHKLTDLKRKFLQEPGNYAEDLFGEYVAEMMSAGNLHADLAREWGKLPESKKIDLAAVDSTGDFADLFLNATNPEVKEAGELMLKGGNPFLNRNTELQVLYWLGMQNWLGSRGDDTSALAGSMVNGLFVTTGDDEVRQAVYKNTNDILNFGRETAEIQKALGLPYNLEDYPLEAKLCWAWIGNVAQVHSPYPLINGRVNLKSYKWNTLDINTLKEMRKFGIRNGIVNNDVATTVANLESHFRYNGPRWEYSTINSPRASKIIVDGESVWNYHIGNVDFQFRRYSEQGKIIGDCVDQSGVVDAFSKALGISTTFIQKWRFTPVKEAHMHVIFYDPKLKSCRGDSRQLNNVGILDGKPPAYSIFFPPFKQLGYMNSFKSNEFVWSYTGFSVPDDMTPLQLYQQLSGLGFPIYLIKEMDKQWKN